MRTEPEVGTSRPASSPSSVLLPEPEAPTMAADSRAFRVNEMSWRIVRVPVASLTCRVRRSTTMMGSDMHSLFGARHTRRRFLHFSVSVCAALAPAFSGAGAAAAPPQEIVVVGDSISAEFGLARGTGWVALLGQR